MNHLRVALRSLAKQRAYAAINVLGLAVGLACCLLIGLFVRDEFSYDRFHVDADRLVFVGAESTFGGQARAGMETPRPFALAGPTALIVVLTTVGAQALRAAQADPVTSLRSE